MITRVILPTNYTFKRFIQTSTINYKGHAKWQNIKHIKATNDQQRSQMIAKQVRMMQLAVHEGGSANPELNSMLRNAIEEARKRYVPQSTIHNALKRFGKKDAVNSIRRHLFEIRLYRKLFVILSIYTDNLALAKNQLSQPLRKHFAEITSDNKRIFTERGVICVVARPEIDANSFEDECLNDAIECGAEDIEVFSVADRQVTFYCDPQEFIKTRQKLSSIGHQIEHSECMFLPNGQPIKLSESEAADYAKFKDRLNAVDGLDEIYDNAEDTSET